MQHLEQLGYPTTWTNEVVGKDALVQISLLLAATEHMVFGTCVANMWVRPAQTANAAATFLAEAFPGRFILGVGVSYPQQAESVGHAYGSPLDTAREYLRTPATYPRILAAMGPKMLALAGEISDGALPAGVDAMFTAEARSVLGPDKLLVIYADASGDPTTAAATLGAHLAAGADHVIAGSPMGADFTASMEQLARLAPRVLSL